jgi:hypothetical protein
MEESGRERRLELLLGLVLLEPPLQAATDGFAAHDSLS